MAREKPWTPEQLRRYLKTGVSSGDKRHSKHTALVAACGRFLLAQQGVLVWANDTGRFTGKATYGTPGVPDLIGWRIVRDVYVAFDGKEYEDARYARFLAVECKVGRDKLRPAQAAFRKECEDAGGLYFLAHWSGKPEDKELTADLERQWAERGGRADGVL